MFSAADMLGMSVVHRMRGVGKVYMCLTRGGVGGEWIRRLVLSLANPMETGGVLDVCLCCVGVGGGGFGHGMEGSGGMSV